jgi:hypothetical protein
MSTIEDPTKTMAKRMAAMAAERADVILPTISPRSELGRIVD